jgi:hypothetical protein
MIAHSQRLNAWLRILILLAVGTTLTTRLFAQISFNDFSNVSSLALNGSAAQANNGTQEVLRLTADGTFHVSGTAWFQTQQQSVYQGFTSIFQFQISHNSQNGDGPADGLAFVIQNSTGDGYGLQALGGSGSAIGYGIPSPPDTGNPIPNSLAVEFDTFLNGPYDPNGNHIAVQSCSTDPNTQDHLTVCPNGNLSNLGIAADLGSIVLSDGNVHTAVVEYDPTAGTLTIYLDNLGTPVLTVSVDLSTLLNLNQGSAWVGFTGGTGNLAESNDILSWTFSPANVPTTITQGLTPSQQQVQTNYAFGSYNYKPQYSNANSGDTVAVTSTPTNQQTFNSTRLQGTIFSNAQCVIYDGAGGNCVLFEVNCTQTQGADCTSLNYDLFNNFNTSQNITGACVLKAPIGTNNWQNIIEDFTQTRNDPGTHSGSKGFSDFIVAQNCTAPPTVTISSPANGSTVIVGQTVTIGFACASDPNAPFVTITSCTGLLNGNPVNNGAQVVFNQVGPGSLVVTATDSVLDTTTQTSNFTVGQVPAFTSQNGTTFQVGVLGSFTVTTTGFPPASITENGALPNGVTLVSHGDGTATLGGTPAANTGGVYNITLMASNSAGNASQGFVLTVLQAPAITSPNNTTFQVGVAGNFTVTTTGYPTPSLGESGALPNGVSFHDNGNGTGTLGGTPTVGGTFNISFTATNTAGSSGQNFTLTVSGGAQVSLSPSSIDFGNVKFGRLVWQELVVKNVGTAPLQFSKIYITDGTADHDDYSFFSFCGWSLRPGKSCLITVYFFADDLGLRTATLNIADNAPNSPQEVPLSGTVIK